MFHMLIVVVISQLYTSAKTCTTCKLYPVNLTTKYYRVEVIYLLILLWMTNASHIQRGNWNLVEIDNSHKEKMVEKKSELVITRSKKTGSG